MFVVRAICSPGRFAVPDVKNLLSLTQGKSFAYEQWFALTVLSMLSVIFLPRAVPGDGG